MPLSPLGVRIEKARTLRAIEKKELARRAGISETYLGYLIYGVRRNPRPRVIRGLASALSVSVEWLWTGQGDMEGARPSVPLLGKVPAARSLPGTEDAQGIAYVPEGVSAPDYALIVREDTMTYEGIAPGDIVFVRRQPWAEDGDVVVAVIEDERGEVVTALKRFRRRPDAFVLEPGDLKYDPVRPKDVQVLGKVVGVARDEEEEGQERG